MYRDRLAEIEDNWKITRQGARLTLLKAITEEGLSVATAAAESGHHRQTIKHWLDVYNAEQKLSQK